MKYLNNRTTFIKEAQIDIQYSLVKLLEDFFQYTDNDKFQNFVMKILKVDEFAIDVDNPKFGKDEKKHFYIKDNQIYIGRTPIKVSKFFSYFADKIETKFTRSFGDDQNINYSPADVGDIAEAFSAYMNSFKDIDERNLKIDTNINEGYSLENCEDEGDIANSCMVNRLNRLKLYKDNGVEIIKYYKDDKIILRALKWKLTDGRTYIDRMYGINNYITILMETHLKRKNPDWVFYDKYKKDRLVVKLNKWDYLRYPYLDTFEYLNFSTGEISNNFKKWDPYNEEIEIIQNNDHGFSLPLNEYASGSLTRHINTPEKISKINDKLEDILNYGILSKHKNEKIKKITNWILENYYNNFKDRIKQSDIESYLQYKDNDEVLKLFKTMGGNKEEFFDIMVLNGINIFKSLDEYSLEDLWNRFYGNNILSDDIAEWSFKDYFRYNSLPKEIFTEILYDNITSEIWYHERKDYYDLYTYFKETKIINGEFVTYSSAPEPVKKLVKNLFDVKLFWTNVYEQSPDILAWI